MSVRSRSPARFASSCCADTSEMPFHGITARCRKRNLGFDHRENPRNLKGATLRRANLKHAVYDDGTDWPDDFEYETSGARHVSEAKADTGSVSPSD